MARSKVILSRCSEYAPKKITEAIQKQFELLGGLEGGLALEDPQVVDEGDATSGEEDVELGPYCGEEMVHHGGHALGGRSPAEAFAHDLR